MFINTLSVSRLNGSQQILSQGGGVEWLGLYGKSASCMALFGRHLGKTLFSQDYESLSMNSKQLLPLERTAFQHVSIILLCTYVLQCIIIKLIESSI